ncbi:DUF6597 domain-containing transcriptional factor [Paenibacillus sp. 1P07SE]|uniref:DUF6597 domain-containing transcriptional factor n=1 Tax=Paenibacillus sp. 1P07SE TaxID=3132209 RepID=UPI0039A66F01
MRHFLPLQAPVVEETNRRKGYRYREFSPHPKLADCIACYWSLEVSRQRNQPILHRILPDGCVDLIFDLTQAPVSAGAFTAGLMASYRSIPLSEPSLTVGIRMFIPAVRLVTGAPVAAFGEARVPVEALWGRGATDELLEKLADVLAAASPRPDHSVLQGILAVLEMKLMKLFAHREQTVRRADGRQSLLLSGLQQMYVSSGMLPVSEVAAQLGYSERSLRRLYQDELSMGPKELSGIIRFQSLLRQLHRTAAMAEAAYDHGFYDQPHMIRLFKRYYGLPPGQIFPSTSVPVRSLSHGKDDR